MPGAPSMKMYSRDELMNMKNFGDEDADDEDDDNDDEAFPSKLVLTICLFHSFLIEIPFGLIAFLVPQLCQL